MGDSYTNTLPSDLLARVRGVPANYFGDLVPVGFIKPFENISSSPDDIPNGIYSFSESDNFEYASGKTVKSYEFSLPTSQEDLKNVLLDQATGKKEKIYYVYIQYVYLSNIPVLVGANEYLEGAFEIPNTQYTPVYRVHVYNEERFIPGVSTEFDIYVVAGSVAKFKINPYYKGSQSDLENVFNVAFEEPRFSAGVIKLLPSRSISLWLGFGGGIELIRTFDIGAPVAAFWGTVFGAGLIDLFTNVTATVLRLAGPAIYRPFYIKFGYTVCGSSQTIFDEEYKISRQYLRENCIKGSNCYLLEIDLGSEEDFVTKGFCVSRKKFNFNDVEKRYVGKGLQDSGDFRDGIARSRFLDSEPVPFAIVKDKKITSSYMRQVSAKYDTKIPGTINVGSVYTSMPEEYIPGGKSKIQILLPLNFFENLILPDENGNLPIDEINKNKEEKSIFITYQKVKQPQIRQVNSYRFRVATTSAANISADAVHDLHSSSFTYDRFYVKKSIEYDFFGGLSNDEKEKRKTKKIVPVKEFITANFDQVEDLQGYPSAYFDNIYQPTASVPRPTLRELFSPKENENSISLNGCYRLSYRRVREGSVDFFLHEGAFIAASRFIDINQKTIDGGIAYIDGFGNISLLIKGSDILDKDWWNDNFASLNRTIYAFDYIEQADVAFLKYDRSLYCNSILLDYEKIGYDIVLAEAIQSITPISEGGVGIGICLLDFIDFKKSFMTPKSIVGDAILNKSNAIVDGVIDFRYIDLSEANFDNVVSPNWSMNVVQVTNPPLNIFGENVNRGTIVAQSFSFDISPIALSRNGRVFWEGVSGIGAAEGVNPYEQLWVYSNLYDVKVGFASDYYKNIGLYGKFDNEKNNIRIFPVEIPSIVSFSNIYSLEIKKDKIDKDTEDYNVDAAKWQGFPVDRIPFYKHGINLMETETDIYTVSKIPDSVISFKRNKIKYQVISNDPDLSDPSIKGISKQFYGKALIKSPDNSRLHRVTINALASESLLSTLRNAAGINEMALTFSASLGNSISVSERKSGDSTVFAGLSILDNNFLTASFYVPNYQGDINLSGPGVYFLNQSLVEVIVTYYDESSYDNFIFQASDVYPAIDGYTLGYVGCINPEDSTPSLDIYTTGDHDRRWKLFRNVFQTFQNDNLYQLVLKADQKGTILYIMFALNGILLCKPIDGSTIAKLRTGYQKVVSKGSFLISESNGTSGYGLHRDAYDILQNTDNSFDYDLDHFARMQSSYVVQARYSENETLMQEHVNTNICSSVNEEIKKSRSSNQKIPKTISVFFDKEKKKAKTFNVPDSVLNNDGSVISPRIYVPSIPSDGLNPNRYWPVNQPYTFEILSDGSLVAFILRDGFIHVFQSNNGSDWSPKFGINNTIGCRPIKYSILDQDSYINFANSTNSAGACPPIDNISSCYDFSEKKLTLFYVVSNCIFAQHFNDKLINSIGEEGLLYYLNTLDVSATARASHPSRPFYVVGEMPTDLISAGKEGNNYISSGSRIDSDIGWNSSIEKRAFLAGIGESSNKVRTNGKAPGAAYVGSGIIRMYYEDEDNVLRGATIINNSVQLDLNRYNG